MPGPQPGRDEHQNTRLRRRAGQCGALVATAGQACDCPQALGLLEGLDKRLVIADTCYDNNANRAYYAGKGIAIFIPRRPNRLEPVPIDEKYYRNRNKMERFFGRMKQCRRLAIRYDKTVVSFLALWYVAAALDWFRR